MRRLLPFAVALFVLGACGTAAPLSASTGPTSPQPIREALVSANGETIVIPGAGGACETGFAAAVVATSPDVRVRLTGHVPDGDLVCMPIDLQRTKISLALQQPLGKRRLIDDSTGRPIPFITEQVLAQPAFLPLNLSPALDLPENGWTRVYGFPASYYRGQLWISQTPWPSMPDLSKMTGTTIQHVDVNGHPALLIDGLGHSAPTYVSWKVDGYTITVSSNPAGSSYQRPSPTDVVLQIARGLTMPRADSTPAK